MSSVIDLNLLDWSKLSCPVCGQTTLVLEQDFERLRGELLECQHCGVEIRIPPADPTLHPTHVSNTPDGTENVIAGDLETQSGTGDSRCESLRQRAAKRHPLVVKPSQSGRVRKNRAAAVREGTVDAHSCVRIQVAPDSHDVIEPGDWRERAIAVLAPYRKELGGACLSFAVHSALLAVLGLILLRFDALQETFAIVASVADVPGHVIDTELEDIPLTPIVPESRERPVEDPEHLATNVSPVDERDLEPALMTGKREGPPTAIGPAPIQAAAPTFPDGSGFEGRGTESRAALVARHGGSTQSEAAVELGLDWLARHQRPDGSWSFQHQQLGCARNCDKPGNVSCTTGATGMALLCFLGAGYTHQHGDYQDVVRKGLDYLRKCEHGDLRFAKLERASQDHARMYAQGLASVALCEAYGMTRDRSLIRPAQQAVDFIVAAQDLSGGGWRYQPGAPGDTSVVGWQVMALVSAGMANLSVPSETNYRTMRFLDSVHYPDTGAYGYMAAQPNIPIQFMVRESTTAIGLLCRMYLGWELQNPQQQRGIDVLARIGPQPNDMYFNYYATQVLHHAGGQRWYAWNEVLRERLVKSQITKGHAKGSWPAADRWASHGGRLYMTCLCVMTLEVYYRHMPLYRAEAVK